MTTMNGHYLAQGITAATGDELRLIYALVCETELKSLIMAKAQDLFNKEIDHFEKSLNEAIKRLKKRSDTELQLELFLHIQKQLNLPGSYYNTKKDFEAACERIVVETHQHQLKKDKEYREFVHGQPQQELEAKQLVTFQMQKIFESFDATIQDLDDGQNEQFIDQVEHYLQSLPLDKQKEIKEKLNINDLTSRTIRDLMLTQGSAAMLAIIVEVMGFAAFTTLTSTIAAITGFFGITLSFSSYIFLTSAFSILTGPIGLIAIAAGGGVMLKKQNDKVSKMFVPVGVVQLLLPIMMGEPEGRHYEAFIEAWMVPYEKQKAIQREIHKLKGSYKEYEHQLSTYRELKYKAFLEENKEEQDREQQMAQMARFLEDIPENEKSARYLELSSGMKTILLDKAKLEKKIALNDANTGMFHAVKNLVANTSLRSKISDCDKLYERVAKQRVDEAIEMKPPCLKKYWEAIAVINAQIKSCKQQQQECSKKISEAEKALVKLKEHISAQEKDLKVHQKRWYGLKDVK